jgi:hypothetical protein
MILDHDVGCPIPDVPESVFGGYNWFLSAIGFGRILSQAYTFLFSVSAAIQTTEMYHMAIEEIETRLERWRMAIPVQFRPGIPSHDKEEGCSYSALSSFVEPSFKMAMLQTNFHYYGLIIALARLKMHIGTREQSRQQERYKRLLMDTARAVVEESKHVDIAAHTPNL